ILAVADLGTNRCRSVVGGVAQAIELNVARVYQAVLHIGHIDLWCQPSLVIIKFPVISTNGGACTLNIVTGHYTPVGRIPTELGVGTIHQCTAAYWHPVRSFEERVGSAKKGPPIRHARMIPFVKILARDGKGICQLHFCGNLSNWQKDLFGL